MSTAGGKDVAAKKDGFGCSLNALSEDRHIAGGGINLYLKGASRSPSGWVTTPGSSKGFLVGISTKDGHRRRIFGKNGFTTHDLDRNQLYVRSLADDYKAEMEGAFGFALCEISHSTISELSEGLAISGINGLRNAITVSDPTLGGLTSALFAAIDDQSGTSRLFIDYMATAIGLHIIHTYGNGRSHATGKRTFLSTKQEKIAREFLLYKRDGDVSIDEVSSACGMTRARFLSAFRQSTGKTPHQWMMAQRVEYAQSLLLKSAMSLGEISDKCGFADQAHFTRVFSNATGVPPGAWRRLRVT